MRQRLTEPDDRPSETGPEMRAKRNRRILISFAMLIGLTYLLTAGMPAVVMPAAVSQVFSFAAFGGAVAAVIGRERMMSDHLTFWDLSAALIGLSILASVFVDQAAIVEYLESMAGAVD